MTRRLRLIMPAGIQMTALIILALPYIAQGVVGILGDAEDVFITIFFQVLAPAICAMGYGLFRVLYFYPLTHKKYGQWLATTPWAYGKPLPLGPVHLVWEDLLVVVVLILAALVGLWNFCTSGAIADILLIEQFHAASAIMVTAGIIAACFFLTYLIILTLAITAHKYITAVLFLIPLILYPHLNLWIGTGIFGLICVLVFLGLRHTLQRFPWNSPQWTRSPRELLLDDVHRQGLIGWPYRQIGPPRSVRQDNETLASIVFCAMVGWWMLAGPHLALMLGRVKDMTEAIETLDARLRDSNPSGNSTLFVIWFLLVLFLTACRLFTYLRDTLPPISLIGRVRTGRWVIPGYDKVLVTPILMVLYGWFGPGLWVSMGLPLIAVPAVSMTGLLLLCMLLGPTKESWRHTGQYRARAWGPPTKVSKQQQVNIPRGSINNNLTGPSRLHAIPWRVVAQTKTGRV